MARVKWDQPGEKKYKTGVEKCVLYLQDANGTYPNGVPWNGITSATESPSGAEANNFYADNIKYLSIRSAEDFGGSIQAYFYPDEWDQCNGEAAIVPGVKAGQQSRATFGLAFQTKIGNDIMLDDYGYEIHLWYGCSASPSDQTYESINDSPNPGTFDYEISSIPVPVELKKEDGTKFKPISSLVIDSTSLDPEKLAKLEDILYGTGEEPEEGQVTSTGTNPRLPKPDELVALLAEG